MSRRRARRNEAAPAAAPGAAGRFVGTRNARVLRALRALLRGPVDRIVLDDVVGCTNAPYVVQGLRDMGLELPCERLRVLDRDGRVCRPGRYSLTAEDRARVMRWAAADPDAAAALV